MPGAHGGIVLSRIAATRQRVQIRGNTTDHTGPVPMTLLIFLPALAAVAGAAICVASAIDSRNDGLS